MTTKINNIIENLKSLTLLEAAELVKEIEQVFGVDTSVASSSAVIMKPDNNIGDGTKNEEEKTDYNVILDDVPAPKKIAILKVVRSLTGLGLKDAKTLVEAAPKVLKESIAKEEAEEIKKQLEEAGASVEIK